MKGAAVAATGTEALRRVSGFPDTPKTPLTKEYIPLKGSLQGSIKGSMKGSIRNIPSIILGDPIIVLR